MVVRWLKCVQRNSVIAAFSLASTAGAIWLVFTLLPVCLPEDVIPFPPLSQSQSSFLDLQKLTFTRYVISGGSTAFSADGARSQKRKAKYVFVSIFKINQTLHSKFDSLTAWFSNYLNVLAAK